MLEVRMTGRPLVFDLVDESGPVGELVFVDADEEDPSEGWMAELGPGRLAGPFLTVVDAVGAARGVYSEVLAERRRLERFYRARWRRTVSTPMGGQPRR